MEEQSNHPENSPLENYLRQREANLKNYLRQRDAIFPYIIVRVFSAASNKYGEHKFILYFTQLFLVFLLLFLFIDLSVWKYAADDGTVDLFENFLVTELGGDLGVLIYMVSGLTVVFVPFLVFGLFLRVLFPTFSQKYLEKEISRLTLNHFVEIDRIMRIMEAGTMALSMSFVME